MKITIQHKDGSKEIDLQENATVLDAITKYGSNSEEVLVVRNKEILTEDEKVNDKDKLEFKTVVSGG